MTFVNGVSKASNDLCKRSIAIISSESNFIDAFSSIHNDIFGGIIDYADYDSPDFTIDVDNGFNSIMCKRASYDYE